jgi:hypothetical protein
MNLRCFSTQWQEIYQHVQCLVSLPKPEKNGDDFLCESRWKTAEKSNSELSLKREAESVALFQVIAGDAEPFCSSGGSWRIHSSARLRIRTYRFGMSIT